MTFDGKKLPSVERQTPMKDATASLVVHLTEAEEKTLAAQEKIITAGVRTVFAVGEALRVIRDGKLYRDTHATFEEYCQEKWQFTHRRANQLAEGSETVKVLGTMVPKRDVSPVIPQNERQIRPLAGLPSEQKKEAWKDATKDTPTPTGKQVAAAVVKVKTGAAALPIDDRGITLPADKVELWNRRGEFDEIAKLISKARCALRDAQKADDELYAGLEFSDVLVKLDSVHYTISSTKPLYVCPMCQGQGCRACKKIGLIGKFAFERVVPAEFKKKGEK